MRFIVGVAALTGAVTVPAQAGVLADDLSRCLITKATDQDRNAFMAWMFSAISADPKLQKYTTLDRRERDQIAAGAADVFQRLMVVDCRKEAVASLKAEGADATFATFGELGRAATEQMFQSPEAGAELDSLAENFDETKLKALGAEAGIRDRANNK